MSTTVLDRPPAAPCAPPEDAPAPPRRPRLSEALRVGAQYHPQGCRALYNPHARTTCALGAALVGVLGPQWTWTDPHMFEARSVTMLLWEKTGVDLSQRVTIYGITGVPEHCTLASAIMRLNDGRGWTREEIADWLEAQGF